MRHIKNFILGFLVGLTGIFTAGVFAVVGTVYRVPYWPIIAVATGSVTVGFLYMLDWGLCKEIIEVVEEEEEDATGSGSTDAPTDPD